MTTVSILPRRLRMDRVVARLGQTAMHAEVARVGIGKQPLVQARVTVDHLDVPELAQTPPECLGARRKSGKRDGREESDPGNFRKLLRPNQQRPCERRVAEQEGGITPLHSTFRVPACL